jgi:hypothetical protein
MENIFGRIKNYFLERKIRAWLKANDTYYTINSYQIVDGVIHCDSYDLDATVNISHRNLKNCLINETFERVQT